MIVARQPGPCPIWLVEHIGASLGRKPSHGQPDRRGAAIRRCRITDGGNDNIVPVRREVDEKFLEGLFKDCRGSIDKDGVDVETDRVERQLREVRRHCRGDVDHGIEGFRCHINIKHNVVGKHINPRRSEFREESIVETLRKFDWLGREICRRRRNGRRRFCRRRNGFFNRGFGLGRQRRRRRRRRRRNRVSPLGRDIASVSRTSRHEQREAQQEGCASRRLVHEKIVLGGDPALTAVSGVSGGQSPSRDSERCARCRLTELLRVRAFVHPANLTGPARGHRVRTAHRPTA